MKFNRNQAPPSPELFISKGCYSEGPAKETAPSAGFEPARFGLEVQPEGVRQVESGLTEPITSKEFG